jgi:hypothetical protein
VVQDALEVAFAYRILIGLVASQNYIDLKKIRIL